MTAHALRLDRDVPTHGDAHGARLSNGEVELVCSTSFGPRILRYATEGGENALGVLAPDADGQSTPSGEVWYLRGGHRLWRAPEDPVRTYVADNAPVDLVFDGTTLTLTQPPEALSSLVKQLRITLAPRGSRVVIEHRIRNAGRESSELAVWALTAMAPGGEGIFPNPPFVPHPQALLPARRLVLWPYTSLEDSRLCFGPRFVRLRHDAKAAQAEKVGLFDLSAGYCAYARESLLFVKRYALTDAALPYPDLGCNVEAFTNAALFELETLGPLVVLGSGETASHTETWELHTGPSAKAVLASDDEAAAAFAALGA